MHSIELPIGKLTAFLTHAIKHAMDVIVVGPPGVGKTEITKQVHSKLTPWYHENEKESSLHEIHLAAVGEVDFMGIPYNGNFQLFGVIGDIYRDACDGKHIIALADDALMADDDTQKRYMQFQRGRVNSFEFPRDQIRHIMCTNDIHHAARVRGILAPLKSYFHTRVIVRVDPKAWIGYAQDNHFHPLCVAFIASHPDLLLVEDYSTKIEMNPDPRGWERVSDIFHSNFDDDMMERVAVNGRLGDKVGQVFWSWAELARKSIDPRMILHDPTGTDISELEKNAGLMFSVASSLSRFVNETNIDNAFIFIDRLPREFQSVFVKCLENFAPEMLNTQPHTLWLARMAQYKAGV